MDQSENKWMKAAEHFAWDFYESRRDGRLVFHNLHLARRLSDKTAEIGEKTDLSKTQLAAAAIAAWLVPAGFFSQYKTPSTGSLDAAKRFFAQQTGAEEVKDQVLGCIQTVLDGGAPGNDAEKVCSDAWNAALYGQNYEEHSPMMRLEQELMGDIRTTRAEWGQRQLQNLLAVRFYTPYARVAYEPVLARHILRQKQQMEKWLRNEPDDSPASAEISTRFDDLETESPPMRGVQTFFRTNYRTHINLSAIADNKANIMISVNSILISVLITLLSYRNIGETNPQILLPVVIFLVSGLASLTFAVLSARPKVTMLNHGKTMEEIRKNIVFFGNFVTLDLDQYEEAMDAMFRDDQLLYGNMTRDLYFLGKVLDKKYRYLSISYNIFMMGFIATVAAFLYTLFS